MPSLRRALLLGVLLALAVPATAPAALRIGIAENTPNLFADPMFQALGAKYARVVVSCDVMTSGDDELQRITDYLNGAAAADVEPLVTFEHARGAPEICNQRKHRRKQQCRLPTPKRYERSFKASARRQLRATKFMFRLARRNRRNRRIKRLYVYTWFGATTPRFDAGLVAHGRPRPAYREVKKRLRQPARPRPAARSAPGSARSAARSPRRSRGGRPKRSGRRARLP